MLYDYTDSTIYTINSVSDTNNFCSTYNHDNGYKGLKLGQCIQINDGVYNQLWRIAGFDCEYNHTASDGTVKDNGYGIVLMPKLNLGEYPWHTSSGAIPYISSTMHTSTLPTIANNLKNVLGNHLINRNVLLSSEMSNRGCTKLSWTTSYCTLLSKFQCDGIGTSDYMGAIADDGEANYKLPLFNFRYYVTIEEHTNNYNDITCDLRNCGSDFIYRISFNTGPFPGPAISINNTYTGSHPVRPMIYVR